MCQVFFFFAAKPLVPQGVFPKNIHTSPKDWFFGLDPPTPWYFQLSFILLLKICVIETPITLGISNDYPWGGYGYFLEPRNVGNKPQIDLIDTH